MCQHLPLCVIIYILQVLSFYQMIDEAGSQLGINNSCLMKVKNKKLRNDVGFEEIVKFLIYQKAVIDYAGLN